MSSFWHSSPSIPLSCQGRGEYISIHYPILFYALCLGLGHLHYPILCTLLCVRAEDTSTILSYALCSVSGPRRPPLVLGWTRWTATCSSGATTGDCLSDSRNSEVNQIAVTAGEHKPLTEHLLLNDLPHVQQRWRNDSDLQSVWCVCVVCVCV